MGIVLYSLGPSPNSKKVRLALGFKGIAHEVVDVDPADRATLVEVSGQPLAPVLVDGGTVVFDSYAILRHLEANVKREPRLFSADRAEMGAIERWEMFGRTRLGPAVGGLFGQLFSPERDPEAIRKCAVLFDEAAAELEAVLGSSAGLVGGRTTAADLSCAAWISLAMVTPEQASRSPIYQFFSEHLRLPPERSALRRWYQDLNRHDGRS